MSRELLRVRGLTVKFGAFPAVLDVNFDVFPKETLGLVGESGSGKSTLARAVLRLLPATLGTVVAGGVNLFTCTSGELRRRRRDFQMVFQDPLASLDPRLRVRESIAEPLEIHEPSLGRRARDARVADMLERVGLAVSLGLRYPHELSGGQCQRIGVARAMVLRPKLVVCDEAVSSLDVSIQGQIVNLLADLQREFGMAMLFISHNLAVVRHVSHRVLVMYRGRLVETAEGDQLFAAPAHPYTRALLDAVPDPTRVRPTTAAAETGAGPHPGGCAFHDRCRYVRAACLQTVPQLEEVAPGHAVACHRWREVVYS